MPRVTTRHYAEELSWWYASPWAMEVEELPGGGLLLHTAKRQGGRVRAVWGARATANEVATAAGVRRFLTEALYYHLHPRKAMLAVSALGQVCTDEELTAFIRQQQRKVARLTNP